MTTPRGREHTRPEEARAPGSFVERPTGPGLRPAEASSVTRALVSHRPVHRAPLPKPGPRTPGGTASLAHSCTRQPHSANTEEGQVSWAHRGGVSWAHGGVSWAHGVSQLGIQERGPCALSPSRPRTVRRGPWEPRATHHTPQPQPAGGLRTSQAKVCTGSPRSQHSSAKSMNLGSSTGQATQLTPQPAEEGEMVTPQPA